MVYQDSRYRDPEYGDKWRKANPEKVREYSRRNKERHPTANRDRLRRLFAENPDVFRERSRRYYAANREVIAERLRQRRFGLTPEQTEAMRTRQGGLCAICRTDVELVVDHNHATGAIRGLLCQNCNFLVGHGKDDPVILRAAAEYLEATDARR